MGTPIAENRSPMTRRDKGQRIKERGWSGGGNKEERSSLVVEHHKSQRHKELRNKILTVERR